MYFQAMLYGSNGTAWLWSGRIWFVPTGSSKGVTALLVLTGLRQSLAVHPFTTRLNGLLGLCFDLLNMCSCSPL